VRYPDHLHHYLRRRQDADSSDERAVEFLAKPFDHQLMIKTVRPALDL